MSSATPGSLYRFEVNVPPFYIFLDMDDVVADYSGQCHLESVALDDGRLLKRFFARLQPLGNSLAHVLALEHKIQGAVYFLSSPPVERPAAWAEKAWWIQEHLPSLGSERLMLTKNKGLVGGINDLIVDDHPDWAGVENFRGRVIQFRPQDNERSWKEVHAAVDEKLFAHS